MTKEEVFKREKEIIDGNIGFFIHLAVYLLVNNNYQ